MKRDSALGNQPRGVRVVDLVVVEEPYGGSRRPRPKRRRGERTRGRSAARGPTASHRIGRASIVWCLVARFSAHPAMPRRAQQPGAGREQQERRGLRHGAVRDDVIEEETGTGTSAAPSSRMTMSDAKLMNVAPKFLKPKLVLKPTNPGPVMFQSAVCPPPKSKSTCPVPPIGATSAPKRRCPIRN